MEARLADLEVKVGLNDHMLEELNRVIFQQQQQIDRLQQELRALRQQVMNSLPNEQRNLIDEIPPHY